MHRQADLRREAADSSERLAEPLLARRLALLLEYQGTAYAGSQLQANAPTVQGALEQALRLLSRSPRHLGRHRPGLLRDFAWHAPATVDLDPMTEAARLLVGSHDFASFAQPSEARRRPTERYVTRADLREKGELALFDIE